MRLVESLLKHMNIKSVYYYNANFNEAGRVDDKFLPEWNKFIAGQNVRPLIANNALLGDPIFNVVKQLFINFTLFDDADDNMFTLVYKEDEVFEAKMVLAHMIEDRPKFVNIDKFNKVLLVTIAIGETYLQEYETFFKKSQEEYAKKCGYDFKVVTEFLDKNIQNKSTISFNKALVACQEWSTDYDFIIFIDADIFININSPPIHNCIEYGNCIGIIDEYSQPSKEKRLNIQRRNGWETCATDYYKLAGFDIQTDMVFNSGVLVLQPKLHGTFLQKIYNDYLIKSMSSPRGFHFEQSCIGYELQKAKKYKILDNKFNAVWNLTKLDDANINLEDYFTQNYFIHFAGHVDYHKVNLLNNIRTN